MSSLRSLRQPPTYLKAIIGSLVAAIGSLTTASTDGTPGLTEWLIALGVGLTTFTTVFFTNNQDERPVEDDQHVP